MNSLNTRAWQSPDEQQAIFEIAKICPGDFVELGVFRGGTTEIILSGINTQYTVWGIDTWDRPELLEYADYNPQIIKSILTDYDNLILIIGDTYKVGKRWKATVGAILFDADHGFIPTRDNASVWINHLMPGGYAIFHDCHYTGVKQVAWYYEEFCHYELIKEVDTLRIYKKPGGK